MKSLLHSLFFATSLSAVVQAESTKPLPSSDLHKRALYPYQSYQSSNGTNPILEIQKSGSSLGEGFLFFIPEIGVNDVSYIMTDTGDLVWFGTSQSLASHNLRVQQLTGNNVLTFWHGIPATVGWHYGGVNIYNTFYQLLYFVCPELGLYVPKFQLTPTTPRCQGDLHESSITPDNTLMVTAYNVTRSDLTAIGGGSNDWTVEGQFYELNITNGDILFSWKSLQHVPVTATQIPLGTAGNIDTNPFDYFHINSVQKLATGQYLISSRHTFSLYMIDTDGSIIWTFTGTDGGDFSLPPSANNISHFSFQHDGRVQSMNGSNTVVHFFNNNNGFTGSTPLLSTAMTYNLNTATMTSTLLRRLYDPNDFLYSTSQGDNFPLPNGNTIVGYGNIAEIKEYGPDNDTDVRMTVRFQTDGNGTYRGFRYQWEAQPVTLPSLVAVPATGMGYVSWNGATNVTRYVVYAGKQNTTTSIKPRMQVPKTGFETNFTLPNGIATRGGYMRVGAFNGATLLRRSAVIQVAAPPS